MKKATSPETKTELQSGLKDIRTSVIDVWRIAVIDFGPNDVGRHPNKGSDRCLFSAIFFQVLLNFGAVVYR